METLDLHGIRHRDVIRRVEKFVLNEDMPVRVITGNSYVMHQLVEEVLTQHGFNAEPESYWNLGSLIVTDISPC